MRSAFGKIFIGMLFVFIQFRIGVIDILADPIGYWFIYFGVSGLVDVYPIGKRAKNAAAMLAFLTIPTVFIPDNAVLHPLSILGVYMPLLKLLEIVLILFLFQLMLQITEKKGFESLYKETRVFTMVYVTSMVVIFVLGQLPIPLSGISWNIYVIFLNITFVGWLLRFRMFSTGKMAK